MPLEELERLSRDLRQAATTLGPREARFLVDLYYQVQEHRIATNNQARSMGELEEPKATIDFFASQMGMLEKQVQSVLDAWSKKQPLGEWARKQKGIGPVLAAGLLAHIDIAQAPTAGHIWNYAGLAPNIVWEKGQKRPFNARLKVLCWKIGESFVKVSGYDDAFYGKLYLKRKEYELERNERVREIPSIIVMDQAPADNLGQDSYVVSLDGQAITVYRVADKWFTDGNAAAAQKALRKNIGKTTDAYKAYAQGTLPPAQIHARAKRWAVKMFLSHYQQIGWELATGTKPVNPFPIDHMGHIDKLEPPR